jgi:hypothetical protein
MNDIKIGSGSISATLFELSLKDFLCAVQRNRAYQGEEMKEALTELYQNVNTDDTKPIIKEIDATPKREVKSNSRRKTKKK